MSYFNNKVHGFRYLIIYNKLTFDIVASETTKIFSSVPGVLHVSRPDVGYISCAAGTAAPGAGAVEAQLKNINCKSWQHRRRSVCCGCRFLQSVKRLPLPAQPPRAPLHMHNSWGPAYLHFICLFSEVRSRNQLQVLESSDTAHGPLLPIPKAPSRLPAQSEVAVCIFLAIRRCGGR